MSKIKKFILLIVISFFLFSCGEKKEEIGTSKNPIKFLFMPSDNKEKLEQSIKSFKTFLEKDTGYIIDTKISPDILTIVEEFGRQNVDIAMINTLGYLLAHDWTGAEAKLKVVRGYGIQSYMGQLIVRADSGIKKPEDLNNKKIAYTEPYSTTGYLLPIRYFQLNRIKPGQSVFAKSHSKVVEMVYNKEVDVGAVYYEPPDRQGRIQDARKELLSKYPDIEKKVITFAKTGIIPNNPIAFRKDLPEDIKTKLIGALIKFSSTEEGKKALKDSYDITALASVQDKEYDWVREILKQVGKSPEDLVPGGLRIYAKKLSTELTPPY